MVMCELDTATFVTASSKHSVTIPKSSTSQPQGSSSTGPVLAALLGGVIGRIVGLILLVVLAWLAAQKPQGSSGQRGQDRVSIRVAGDGW